MLTFLCLLSLAFQDEQDMVKATVRMENPSRHYYQVEMIFPQSDQVQREIKMAVWTPGSYKIRDFSRHVEEFKAFDLEDRPLPWMKLDKSTWAVQSPEKGSFKVTYEVFAYEFTVRTSYLDSFYGFINPASVFFYEKDQLQKPYEIQVIPEEGWAAASALRKVGTYRFQASNFDELVDSPFQFGPFRRHEFDVKGIPHYWIIAGDVNMNENAMVDALRKVGETVGDLFGSFPFDNYYIFSQFRLDGAGGGLEHLNSTMVQSHSNRFRDKKGWDGFLGLMFHEYFHAWNVKAIRDEALGPFDYQDENYTELLWLHEGWTSYYDTLLMGRAEFYTQKELLEEFARGVQRYLEKPGAKRQSLRDASFNAWIHQYQPTETRSNSQVSYYSEGAVSGLALDLLLRHRSRGEKSLDDVMRVLYNDYALQGRSINWNLLAGTLEDMIGTIGRDFLETYIRHPNPMPMEEFLEYAGLTMTWDDGIKKKDKGKGFSANPKVSLDVQTREQNGKLMIRDVIRDGAGWEAGLDFGDEILAINKRRVSGNNFEKILGWSRPGDEVIVIVSRANKILEIPVKLANKTKKLVLKRDKDASDGQKALFDAMFIHAPDPKKDKDKDEEND